MPPKNKKQLQEEAKRLEQERIKKQEQERRLQEERRKYAAQTLLTGLVLPVSDQLISDFVAKKSSFVNQKLREVLSKEYPDLKDERVIKQILKQMLYNIKNLRKLFNLNDKSNLQESQQKYLKVRVCCGIFLALYLNFNPALVAGQQKSKQADENLLRKLLLSHTQNKAENQQKVFDKKQTLQVLTFFKEYYFDHFLILHKWAQFPKREDEKSFNLYIASPMVEFNNVHTKFVDLSVKKTEANQNQQNDNKIQ